MFPGGEISFIAQSTRDHSTYDEYIFRYSASVISHIERPICDSCGS